MACSSLPGHQAGEQPLPHHPGQQARQRDKSPGALPPQFSGPDVDAATDGRKGSRGSTWLGGGPEPSPAACLATEESAGSGVKTIVVDNREPVLTTELQGLMQQACRTEEDRGDPSVLAVAGEEKGVRPRWLAGVGGPAADGRRWTGCSQVRGAGHTQSPMGPCPRPDEPPGPRTLGLAGLLLRGPDRLSVRSCSSRGGRGRARAASVHRDLGPPSPSARPGHHHGTRCPAFRLLGRGLHRAVLSSQAHESRAPNADSGQPGVMSCEPYFSPLFLSH